MPDPECNICGGTEFVDYKTRGKIRCAGCGSIERTRAFDLYLKKFANLHRGQKVLHFAPERPLFKRIAGIVGPSYHVRDLDVARYRSLKLDDISVEAFDLCRDCEALPSDHYDLIIHNHVMEHIPCDLTAVLWHLHRALGRDGLHMFSIPIFPGRFEASFAEMEPDARAARFFHPEHFRTFGREDLPATIGMVFDIDAQLKRPLVDVFGQETLERCNIPKNRWTRFNGANLFVLRKGDLKLDRARRGAVPEAPAGTAQGPGG